MTLREFLIQVDARDPRWRRKLRRTVGLSLAMWVLAQCVICTLWPILFRQ